MKRILGVAALLFALYAGLVGTYVQYAPGHEASADVERRVRGNLVDVANIQGRYGVITLGAALVIITGGIDLSIGSVIGLTGVLIARVSTGPEAPPQLRLGLVLAMGLAAIRAAG